MDLIQRIAGHFEQSARTTLESLELVTAPIAGAVEILTACLLNSGKILVCGDGTSAPDAAAFAGRLTDRFELERPPLAAIALGGTPGCERSDTAPTAPGIPTLAKQLAALGHPGDALLVICSDGASAALVATIDAAHEREIRVVALTGSAGGKVGASLAAEDVQICIPSDRLARIQETHRLVLNCLCDGIDCLLLGVEDQ
nr:SIS domain-containing protein [Zoogloeaceae bacterium]